MKKFKFNLSAILAIGAVLFGILVPRALAEDIVVSGNGEGSTNQVNVAPTTQTTVTQTNTTNTTNTVTTTANSGNNAATSNTGGSTTVASGDVNSTTAVSNTANISVVNGDCGCQPSGQSSNVISGNGESSNNSITHNSSNTTSINSSNIANIANHVVSSGNTGNNTALGNTGGDTTIKTGNIIANNSILNKLINLSKITYSTPVSMESKLSIIGNGELSLNNLNAISNNNTVINVTNIANIINDFISSLNTGNNSAVSNTGGNVKILTGDILANTTISNYANVSVVDVTCGCQKEVPPTPTTVVPPSVPPPPGPNTGETGGGTVQGASQSMGGPGTMLPSTGGSWLFFALIGNILMFLLGAYLRLRSGRSPGLVYAI